MKRTLLLLAALPLAVADEKKPEGPAAQIASMDWLAGLWRGPAWGGTFVAQYTAPEGGMILSTSKLIKEGKAVYFEFERFEASGAAVTLTPYPKGAAAATFRLTALEGRRATFENPDKDFPTRIVYDRKADDNLVITLSDASGRREMFDLKRAP